ncbi:MAG: stage II sporulation protein M [Candidatus Micrarchaeia archaeon]
MVLEALVDAESAAKNPVKITVLSFFFVTLGIWVAQFFESNIAGIMATVAVLLPSIPLINSFFSYEEKQTEREIQLLHSHTLARHLDVLIVLVAYFIGLIIGFTFWHLALPQELSAHIFQNQISELQAIQGALTTGFATKFTLVQAFELVFMNNLQVLAIILIASVVYGAGSIFILIWNASIIGVFIGSLAQEYVFQMAPEYSVAVGLSRGVFGLIPHGSFELLAYLTAALAGGILSRAIIRKAYKKPEFAVILYDVAKLVSWAILFLAIGALIESNAIVL